MAAAFYNQLAKLSSFGSYFQNYKVNTVAILHTVKR